MRFLLPFLFLKFGSASAQDPADRPNILWITCENISVNVLHDLGPSAAPAREAVEALPSDRGEYVKRLAERLLKTLPPK